MQFEISENVNFSKQYSVMLIVAFVGVYLVNCTR